MRRLYLEGIDLIRTKVFVACLAIYSGLLIYRTIDEIRVQQTNAIGINYFLHFMYNVGGLAIILITISCLPTVSYFLKEWNSGNALYKYIRLHRVKYSIQIILVPVIVTGLLIFIGQMIYVVFLLINQYTFITEMTLQEAATYMNGYLIQEGRYISYYLSLFLLRSFEGIIYCCLTIVVSLVVSNIWIISVVPIVFQAILFRGIPFIGEWNIIVQPHYVLSTRNYIYFFFEQFGFSNHWSTIYPLVYTCVIIILSMTIVYYGLQFKFRNINKRG